jgi:hypothetical protein
MSEISRDDVVSQFGALGDITIAEIIATGVTMEELKVARDFVGEDEKNTNTQNRLPFGPTGRVIELVERVRSVRRYPITGSLLGAGGSGLA